MFLFVVIVAVVVVVGGVAVVVAVVAVVAVVVDCFFDAQRTRAQLHNITCDILQPPPAMD